MEPAGLGGECGDVSIAIGNCEGGVCACIGQSSVAIIVATFLVLLSAKNGDISLM